jgi:hypothetical protein
MTTLWIKFAGHFLLDSHQSAHIDMQVPYLNLVVSLAGLALPLLIGVFVARYRPNWAEKARKVRFFTKIIWIYKPKC